MAAIEINRDPSPGQLRVFAAVVLPGFFALVGGIVGYRTGSWSAAIGVFAPAAAVGLLGLVVPRAVRCVYLGWMYAFYPIGWLLSHLLLAAVYYLCLTPIGLAMRLVGYDPLQRTFDPEAESYWTPRRPTEDRSRYFKQF
jgi:hypothetical protein